MMIKNRAKDLKKIIAIALLGVVFAFCGCGNQSTKTSNGENDSLQVSSSENLQPRYAKGYNVKKEEGIYLLEIQDPDRQNAEVYKFALVPENYKGTIPEDYKKVKWPIKSVICMTTLQLSNFIKLGLTSLVSGVTSTRHLFNEQMKEQLNSGITHRIGIEGNFDKEVLMAINPDAILFSPFKRGGYEALKDIDAPLIPHLGYKELTPLGQAEWIRFVGLLTGHEKEAEQVFNDIEKKYLELKNKVANVKERPVVFSGEMRGGNWYAVGGRSFLAQMFNDAGGSYFLKDNDESGGVTLDYEEVYAQAANAPYWRIMNSFDGTYSYEALKATDERYADFRAFKERGVIYCNMKEVPFYERMPVEPEEVLADFIAIFHPSLLPDHQPSYYHLLK